MTDKETLNFREMMRNKSINLPWFFKSVNFTLSNKPFFRLLSASGLAKIQAFLFVTEAVTRNFGENDAYRQEPGILAGVLCFEARNRAFQKFRGKNFF
ncbi:MAG: hypothetical protein ACR2K1_16100 [Saprospiraceae bacterium]